MFGMSWQPEEGSLAEILRLLKESQSPDTETQRSIEQVSSSISPPKASGQPPIAHLFGCLVCGISPSV